MEVEHTCRHCKEDYPKSEKFWRRKKGTASGLCLSMCKACISGRQNEKREREKNRGPDVHWAVSKFLSPFMAPLARHPE